MARAYDIVKTEQDMTYLSWDEVTCSSGLTGARPKAREGTGPNAVYYKQQHFGELGRARHDCIAELICSRLYKHLGIDHVEKQLIFAKVHPEEPSQWLVRSRSYRKAGERAISLSTFHEIAGKAGETPLRLCYRMGWQDQIHDMVMADFLTATRSRDEDCFEVLASRDGEYRLAPLFSRSFSLANAFQRQTWNNLSIADVRTFNYLGSRSLKDNLALLPEDYIVPAFDEGIRDALFVGLQDITSDKAFLDTCWTVIERRWQYLENIRRV